MQRDCFNNMDQLSSFIESRLCDQNNFETGAFPFTGKTLFRGNKDCGMIFVLHGPRSVQLTAIWDSIANTILFYTSTGERILKIAIRTTPDFDVQFDTHAPIAKAA